MHTTTTTWRCRSTATGGGHAHGSAAPLTPPMLEQRRCSSGRLLVRARSSSGRKQQDLYAVLGVEYGADAQAVKAAFRQRAKQLHPDVNDAPDADEAFRLLKRAHEVLSDSMLRAAHDAELREWGSGAGSAELRARDPRFARFERWRREITPDLNAQLDEWSREVAQLLGAAEAALARQEAAFQQLMMQASPPDASLSGSYEEHSGRLRERRQRGAAILASMRGLLADAAANVQRLYDKRYEQMQQRFPAYPDIVWYDRWLEVSDAWLDESGRLLQRWQPRLTAVAQWLPPAVHDSSRVGV